MTTKQELLLHLAHSVDGHVTHAKELAAEMTREEMAEVESKIFRDFKYSSPLVGMLIEQRTRLFNDAHGAVEFK